MYLRNHFTDFFSYFEETVTDYREEFPKNFEFKVTRSRWTYRCDGERDCEPGVDEEGCDAETAAGAGSASCGPSHMTCASAQVSLCSFTFTSAQSSQPDVASAAGTFLIRRTRKVATKKSAPSHQLQLFFPSFNASIPTIIISLFEFFLFQQNVWNLSIYISLISLLKSYRTLIPIHSTLSKDIISFILIVSDRWCHFHCGRITYFKIWLLTIPLNCLPFYNRNISYTAVPTFRSVCLSLAGLNGCCWGFSCRLDWAFWESRSQPPYQLRPLSLSVLPPGFTHSDIDPIRWF